MPVTGNILELREYLKSHGVRPSYIRLRVFGYLLESKNHPSAEEIYEALQKDIPTLSRASVYNALAALTEAQLVQVLTIEKSETRYDATISEHGHFQCEVCGKIFDFSFALESLQYEGLGGFLVTKKELYFRGICPQCQKGGRDNGKSGENAASWRTVSLDGGQDHSRGEETPR